MISKESFLYWEGLKLRKLVTNDWVSVSPGLVLGHRERVVGHWNGMYLFGGIFIGRFKCGRMGWPFKEQFLYNNSVGLSMCHGLIETVKYIWVNIWFILGWILSKKLQKYTSSTYSWLTSEDYKNIDADAPYQFVVANADSITYQMEEYKNPGLAVILHCLNSFQYTNYVAFSLLYVLFRKNHKMNAVCFPSFHDGCNPACKVWRRLWTGEQHLKLGYWRIPQ